MLGGGAIALALPPLEAFFDDNGVAYAVDGAFPKRFGLFFWGNGILPERWIPSDTGSDWTLTEQLAPLASVRDRVAVISGLEVKTGNPVAHISGPSGLLTGDAVKRVGDHNTFSGPTLDQIIAQSIGGETRFRSLEVGIQPGVSGCHTMVQTASTRLSPTPPCFLSGSLARAFEHRVRSRSSIQS